MYIQLSLRRQACQFFWGGSLKRESKSNCAKDKDVFRNEESGGSGGQATDLRNTSPN